MFLKCPAKLRCGHSEANDIYSTYSTLAKKQLHCDLQETDWTVPDEVTAAKKKQLEEAAAAAARARQAAAEQRAAAMNQLVRGAPRPSGTGFGAGAYDAEAARIAHIQSAMAARKGSGFGAGMSQEARLTGFKALLLEAGVNGFSFWDKVKPKLEKDDR